MMRNDFGRTLLSFSFSGPPNPGSTNATWPHLSHSTRVSSFSIFICLAFLLAGVALQDVVFCSLRS